jgi:hypothetical protein
MESSSSCGVRKLTGRVAPLPLLLLYPPPPRNTGPSMFLPCPHGWYVPPTLSACVCLQVSNTNGVKQQLWGLKLTGRVAPGAAVTSEDGSETLGVVTSYANLEREGGGALAYLKCRRGGVQVGH